MPFGPANACRLLAAVLLTAGPLAAQETPMHLGSDAVLLVDDHAIAGLASLHDGGALPERQFHAAVKHGDGPLIDSGGGYLNVVHDAQAQRFRMIYQTFRWRNDGSGGADYAIAYAESADGLTWTKPDLGLHDWDGAPDNNVVHLGPGGASASSPYLIDVPGGHGRGYRYEMLYRTSDGMRIVGSNDAIHWDPASEVTVARSFWPDTQSSIVHDPVNGQWVMHTRPTDLYPADGQHEHERRQVARVVHDQLFAEWGVTRADPPNSTQVILTPDAVDQANGYDALYGMPTKRYGDLYVGFLWPFNLGHNSDVVTELAFSRDGVNFERPLTQGTGRPQLIELGPEGAWDDGMILGGPGWVEVGDEWWIYYTGHDGPHRSDTRAAGIGLAKLRKEGFASIHAGDEGGLLLTRLIQWDGHELAINADAVDGSVRVRVLDAEGNVLPGFGFDQSTAFTGDATGHVLRWQGGSLSHLAGQAIRFEFELINADLYSFRAMPEPASAVVLAVVFTACSLKRAPGQTPRRS